MMTVASNEPTTPPPTPETDYEALRTTNTFALGPTGVAARIMPPTAAIFRILESADAGPTLRRLVTEDNAVTTLYGLYGLWVKDRAEYNRLVPPFRNDTTLVFQLMGCIGLNTPLNQIIQSWETEPVTRAPKSFW